MTIPAVEDCRSAADENCDGEAACTGALIWSQQFGGPDVQIGADVLFDSHDQVVITGSFGGDIDLGTMSLTSVGGVDNFAAQLDVDGAAVQSLGLGSAGFDLVQLELTATDEFVASHTFSGDLELGDTSMTSLGAEDVAIAALGWDGQPSWTRQVGNASGQFSGPIAIGPDNTITVSGYTTDGAVDLGGGPLAVTATTCGNYLARYESDGTHVWSKLFDGVNSNWGVSVAVDSSGDVAIAGGAHGDVSFGGDTLPGGTDTDVVVAVLDSEGNHRWSQRFGDQEDQGGMLALDTEGSLVLAGTFLGTMQFERELTHGSGAPDIFVAKLSSAGAHRWSRSIQTDEAIGVFSVDTDAADNILLSGWFKGELDFGCGTMASMATSSGSSSYDAYVVKLDPDGDCIWSRTFGGPGMDWADGSTADRYGNVLTTGAFIDAIAFDGAAYSSDGSFDAFVIKQSP